MNISFIIPAHNEESVIRFNIEALHTAAADLKLEYEIIVVDDDSSDRTAKIAKSCRAKVVSVCLRKISAVRNAGAKIAQGNILIFIDADTILPKKTLYRALESIDKGAVGGSARVKWNNHGPWTLGRILIELGTPVFIFFLRITSGCFIYVRRECFEEIGGFDEQYYQGEDGQFGRSLNKLGKVTILWEPVITSSRKFNDVSSMEFIGHTFWGLFSKKADLRPRKLWYDLNREQRGARGK